MNISQVEKYMSLNIGKDMLKEIVGSDNMNFEIMYQALLENAEYNKIDEQTIKQISSSAASSGINLDSIPLILKSDKNLNIYIDTIKNNDKVNEEVTNVVSSNNIDSSKTSLLTVDDILPQIDTWVNKYEPAKGETLEKIYSLVDKYSKEYGVEKNLVLAIIKQESNFDANTVSHAGAMGLMQLMDFNCETFNVKYPLDLDENIRGGVQHIKEYIDMFDGNIEMALMAYNGGPGNMERRGVHSPADLYKMPKETQNYVPKVMNYYKNGFSL